MRVCHANHAEIAFEGERCPICEQITGLRKEVNEAEEEIEVLHAKIKAYQGD
jgi:hypothetical protein